MQFTSAGGRAVTAWCGGGSHVGGWQNREMTADRAAAPPRRAGSLATGRTRASLGDGGAVRGHRDHRRRRAVRCRGCPLLGTVPMGLLAYRYRLRVLIAATVAGAVIAFLIAGMGGFMTVLNCAYIGGLTGTVKRRGRGTTDGVRLRRSWRAPLFGVVVVDGAGRSCRGCVT